MLYGVEYMVPRGSKYPIFKDSGTKSHSWHGFLEPESLNIGDLDPLGYIVDGR